MNPNDSVFLRIALPVPLRQYFDYLPDDTLDWKNLKQGMRVKVPFQRREIVGIFITFISKTDVPKNKLKKISAVLDSEPILSDDILQLSFWAADYYHHPIGDVLTHALPTLLRKGKMIPDTHSLPLTHANKAMEYTLNDAQQSAIDILKNKNTFQVFLLNGKTVAKTRNSLRR